jgi:hypothetical protein
MNGRCVNGDKMCIQQWISGVKRTLAQQIVYAESLTISGGSNARDGTIAEICEQSAGLSDEVIDLRVLDFLAAAHQRWPAVVRLKNPPAETEAG